MEPLLERIEDCEEASLWSPLRRSTDSRKVDLRLVYRLRLGLHQTGRTLRSRLPKVAV
jgi:hypothetical protein